MDTDYGVAVITYSDEDSGVEFRWHGGAYIDVGWDEGEEFHANDVINVWDDEQDRSDFERDVDELASQDWGIRPFRAILEAFEARCRVFLEAESRVES